MGRHGPLPLPFATGVDDANRRCAKLCFGSKAAWVSGMQRKHLTLPVLPDEYIERQPDEYRYSRSASCTRVVSCDNEEAICTDYCLGVLAWDFVYCQLR